MLAGLVHCRDEAVELRTARKGSLCMYVLTRGYLSRSDHNSTTKFISTLDQYWVERNVPFGRTLRQEITMKEKTSYRL